MLTHGSLFTGIGGIDRGFEAAGIKTIWQVEYDSYATKVLEKHWPNVKRYTDITQVDFTQVETPDIVSGGFPCQPVSVAGKRKGKDDERWLWPEFARCLRVLRPRYAVMENVPGLLNLGFGDVLGDLAALGYDAEWDCLPAAAFGAPHLRYRVFIVAFAASEREYFGGPGKIFTTEGGWESINAEISGSSEAMADAERQQFDGGGRTRRRGIEFADGGEVMADSEGESRKLRQPPAERQGGFTSGGKTMALSQEPGLQGNEPARDSCARGCVAKCDWWAIEPDVGRVANGVPSRVDRLKCLGNAVVPQVAEYIGRLIVKHVG